MGETRLGNGTLYYIDNDGNEQEIGTTTDGSNIELENEEQIFFDYYCNGEVTFKIKPFYKKWYKKKKGKRYLHYYKLTNGIDPEIIKKILRSD